MISDKQTKIAAIPNNNKSIELSPSFRTSIPKESSYTNPCCWVPSVPSIINAWKPLRINQ